ncbi:hypothetical protein MKZ38_010140 [Zalerion maritima]|uniref:Uncharacterized protein n=1 Tax=Zalerion maritima TaxID=339359 RepID=A0AAD5WNC6_9PEZI|nr:hypothetical protein MKZ38_010140 [Zalerion maritima]
MDPGHDNGGIRLVEMVGTKCKYFASPSASDQSGQSEQPGFGWAAFAGGARWRNMIGPASELAVLVEAPDWPVDAS